MSYDSDVGQFLKYCIYMYMYILFNVFLFQILFTFLAAATTGRDTDWDKIIKLCDRIRESFGSAA